MKAFTCSLVQVGAVLLSLVVNALLFVALGAGFGRTTEPAMAVLQLPAVTVVGKRLTVRTDTVQLAKTISVQIPSNDIKL